MKKLFAVLKKWNPQLIVTLVAILALAPMAFKPTNNFEISKNLEIFTTLYKELNTYYVDELEPNEVMRNGIDAMLGQLDPYTNFISEAEMEGYKMQTTGKYGGIGALIRNANDKIVVAEPYKDYPADRAGLKAGDEVLQVDGQTITGKSVDDISKVLKGAPGTSVIIKVKRMQADASYKEITVTLTREEIKIKNVPYYGMINNNIAYIKLLHFTENAGKDVADALESLKKTHDVKGVVFDLRGNPGGLLNEAVNVSNVFIDKNEEIVSTRGKNEDWDKVFKTLNQPVDTKLPLVVLTSRGSASASEIVSGSIQDLDRGVIVGQKTYGKGLVQTTRDLSYNTKLKLTTAKYYIPSGRCIQSLDYSHRNDDGSVGTVPDSLKTEFKTKNGRSVWDGGGIDPDVLVEHHDLSNIALSLLSKNLIFDYATLFSSQNTTMPSAKDFTVNEATFDAFVAYLKYKDYDYQTESEKALDELKKNAEKEKYFDALSADYDEMKALLAHDKEQDLYTFKEEIMDLLTREIVGRFYYQEGIIEASFKSDKDILRALELFNNPAEYSALLLPQ